MHKKLRTTCFTFLAFGLCCGILQAQAPKTIARKKFTLHSSTLQNGATMTMKQVFNGFGCSGENVSPELSWFGAPPGTKSFALTMYDPDAPTGSGWWHWVIFNIPTTTNEIPEGAGNKVVVLPGTTAVQSMTDFGKPGYGGPCPPAGDTPHHYTLTIYALKVAALPLTAHSPGAMVGYYINQNSLGNSSVTGLYGR